MCIIFDENMSALKDGVFFYFCELISVGERRPWAVQKDSKIQREATDKRIKRYIQEELERCGVGEGKKGGGGRDIQGSAQQLH